MVGLRKYFEWLSWPENRLSFLGVFSYAALFTLQEQTSLRYLNTNMVTLLPLQIMCHVAHVAQ